MKRAFITGIDGQDGSYLAEFLLEKGYSVHGLVQKNSKPFEKIHLYEGDLKDRSSLEQALFQANPDEIYNLAAVSHEQASLISPEHTANINAFGVLRLLEIVKAHFPKARFFQASSAELFGKPKEFPQTEKTHFQPYSPYGVAKLYAHWTVANYRETHSLYACNGILFNHESPRRGDTFVSKKISLGVAQIKKGLQEKLILGNLNAKRDWGYAKDFVEGMWKMLQQKSPEDFVLASGELHSVREFVELAFQEVGISLIWEGQGIEEKGLDKKTNKILVEVSPSLFRPVEILSRVGDPTKAREKLGWICKASFTDLVKLMVDYDLKGDPS